MTESFGALERLFREVMALEPDARSGFLDAVQDDALREDLRGLVAARSVADGFFAEGPELVEEDSARVGSVGIGETLGEFRIERALATGGMGSVFVAEQRSPPRAVALKVIRPEIAGHVALARFRLEAEILGSLRHPGIAQIYGAGVHENSSGSIPWLAMELIDGIPLDQWVSTRNPTRSDRCRLFVALCEAAEHAHRQGIIHRDLKPANVLVTGDDRPKIVDFGVARVADVNALATVETELRRIVGTLSYMSPEQTTGNPHEVDTRVDVYALGAILHEILTGARAFELGQLATLEALRVIREDDPPRLSTLEADLRGDLELIVTRAMDKERERRYGSALALGEDVQRHLAHLPVTARRPTVAYRVRKFVRRNPATAIGLMSTVLAILVGLGGTLLGLERAREESALKNAALADFERMSDVRRVSDAFAEAESLWPARPEMLEPLKEWLGRARDLVARRARHEATLSAVQERALPYGQADRRREHAETFALIDQLRDRHRRLEERAADVRGARLERIELKMEDLAVRLEDLEAKTRVREAWSFGADRLLQWKSDVLTGLLRDLTRLAAETIPDVEGRLAKARSITAETIEAHAEAWARTVASIRRDERYGKLTLRPQVGLVPLGKDPISGCYEFLHVESHRGQIPTRDAEGEIPVEPDTGVILVLVPGGRFTLGASRAEDALHHDPNARPDESPLHEVDLAPYFLSKYELTRGQWERITAGPDPSHWTAANTDGLVSDAEYRRFPVEQVSYDDCVAALRRVALELPTEARWERACRAGTTTPYSFGDDPLKLDEHTNAADRTYAAASDGARHDPELDDGFPVSAPVGSFAPNPLGFHDMHGNVSEWCLDAYTSYDRATRPKDGLRTDISSGKFVIRGGSFNFVPILLRTSFRYAERPDFRINLTGCRPAMSLRRGG